MNTFFGNTRLGTLALGVSAALASSAAFADQVILDDLIVDGSACIGFDCVNGESFGFDTLRLKENNLRIKAQDTSASASFPSNDWQITFNDSSNGGANKFSIDDITGGRTPFTIEATAPSNSLYVDDGGRVGLGTSTPAVELQVVDGDSPTLRLEQNGSSGFTPQTWDLAGNETNFFVRDATNGSKLPFKIRPSAPTNSLFVDTNGDIGLGTASPDAVLDVESSVITQPLILATSTGNTSAVGPIAVIKNTNATTGQRHMLSLENSGTTYLSLIDTSVASGDNLGQQWNIFNAGGLFRVTSAPGGAGETELELDNDGNLTISGSLITTGGGGACTLADPCDRVFDTAVYEVPSIEVHAEKMWENKFLPAVGPTGPGQPFDMTKKMLRMLNELEHAHIYIEQLHQRLEVLEKS